MPLMYNVLYLNPPYGNMDLAQYCATNIWQDPLATELRNWSNSLTPEYAVQEGFAYSCFRLNGRPHICLATVIPNFVTNLVGVPCMLTHVRVVATQEPGPNVAGDENLHLNALVQAATAFNIASLGVSTGEDRIRAYIANCITGHEHINVAPPTAAMLRPTNDPNPDATKELLSRIVTTAYTTFATTIDNPNNPPVFYRLPKSDMRALVYALGIYAAALPPRLRLYFYWGCGVRTMVRRQANIEPSNQFAAYDVQINITQYVDRFWHSIRANQADLNNWPNAIWNNWDVLDWPELFELTEKAKQADERRMQQQMLNANVV